MTLLFISQILTILQLDYNAIAAMYGRSATYDAVESRFRKFRKIADELRAEASKNGVTVPPRGRNGASGPSTPRTPRARGPRNGVTKSSGSSGRSTAKLDAKLLGTPTKIGGRTLGQTMLDAIAVDTDSESNGTGTRTNTGASISRSTIKVEDETAEESQVLHSIKAWEDSAEKKADVKTTLCTGICRKQQPYVDSQTNSYVDGPVAGPSSANNFDVDADIDDIGEPCFGNIHSRGQYDNVDLYDDTA